MSWLKFASTLVLVTLSTLASVPCRADESTNASKTEAARLVRQFCVECHAASDAAGDREFETLDWSATDADTQRRLQEMIDQVTLGAMPPEDADQPTDEQRLAALEHWSAALQKMRGAGQSTGGRTVLRRLSRREYRNTVRDLLGIDVTLFDPTQEFPADNLVGGYDNQGGALVTSGYLLEKYLQSAEQCVEKALQVDAPTEVKQWTFRGDFFQQNELRRAHQLAFDHRYLVLYDHPLNDKPEGAYGPLAQFREGVPVDGIYEVEVLAEALHRDTPYGSKAVFIDLDEPFRLGIRPGDTRIGDMVHTQPIQPLVAETNVVDNELRWYRFRIPLDRGWAPRFTFENGQHDVRGAYSRVFRFHQETLPESVRGQTGIVAFRNAVVKHGYLPQIRIHEVKLRGPIDQPWPTDGRQKLFGGDRFDPSKAEQQLRAFAKRAYRREVTEAEIATLLRLIAAREKEGATPEKAYQAALQAVLCSPGFLYFKTPQRADQETLDDYGIAERLAYFLTSTMPDETLSRLAADGQLQDPNVRREQARRLLASTASDRFVADLLDGWLNLRSLGSMPPDPQQSRDYYARGLEEDMKGETQAFLRDLIDRDASVLEWLRADYSFANRDLAKLYGVADQIPLDQAATFHRVTFAQQPRGGLLGQASILTVSANGIETSPVIRGVWLMEKVLGTPAPTPPDEVPAFDPDVRGTKTIREQLIKHRESPACSFCHQKIDPLGFALEGFDPIGRDRRFYDAKRQLPIDTSGELPGGESFDGPMQLRQVLLSRRRAFARAFTNQLLTYALGRQIEAGDRLAIEDMLSQLEEEDYPTAQLIETVVASDLFVGR